MRGILVFFTAFIVATASHEEIFAYLDEPGRTLAAIGIGIMLTISFIKGG